MSVAVHVSVRETGSEREGGERGRQLNREE